MSGLNFYPQNYQLFSSQETKQLNVVLEIEGLDTIFGVQNSYSRIRYGDPETYYGQTGLVYGGLRLISNSKPYLQFDQGLTLSQRLEPEQGRASISQFSISLIDYNGEVSRIVSPGGGILPEVLGRRVIIRMGYVQTSYPDDYCVIFRGIITQIQSVAGRIIISTGDANQKLRVATFQVAKAKLTSAIDASQLNIPVTSVTNFYSLIYNEAPALFDNWKVKPYLKIQDEVIPYGFGAIGANVINVLSRGARLTTAAPHDIDSDVTNCLEIQGHPINLALRLMLSGLGGAPYETGVKVSALGVMLDPTLPPATNVVFLPQGVNADIDYGLSIGDRVQIFGSTAGNDGTYTITNFGNSQGFYNRIIYLNQNLNAENPSPATLSLYSQFDVYPQNAGLALTPKDVDVKTFINCRDKVFTSAEYFMRFYITTQQVGKAYIEQEILLPIAAYSLTRYGRLSMGYMRPPTPTDKVIVLDGNNILEPQNISVTRSLNNRKFYNQVQYQYDKTDAGNFESIIRDIDLNSVANIGITQLLPINASGTRTEYGGGVIANRITKRLLTRFKNAAFDVVLNVQWNPGTFIEAGDCVVLRDQGTLQLTNFATGEKDMGVQVFEVTDRTVDIKNGQIKLTLTSGLGNNLSDRYGSISPSSQIGVVGSSRTKLRLKQSYGNTLAEITKWQQFIGILVEVHSYDYTIREVKTLVGVDPSAADTIILDSALTFDPIENMILDVAYYGSSSDPTYNQLAKAIFASSAPSLTVISGLSQTQFYVSLPDFAKILVGAVIQVRNADYSLISPEVKVLNKISPNTVEVESLGFSPSLGQKVEIVGFLDAGGAYRYL